ncbi:MAG TPA: hypothetical protein VHB20_14655 [Verrucomicrobiae bacterium]|jgi:predicted RNase H-like nuclease (RuvC/YqgF family)|nr:hypothetical protein [Verrucomicrobiae bacterium]
MKLKILKNVTHLGEFHRAGAVVELPDTHAALLIDSEHAKSVNGQAPKLPEKADASAALEKVQAALAKSKEEAKELRAFNDEYERENKDLAKRLNALEKQLKAAPAADAKPPAA